MWRITAAQGKLLLPCLRCRTKPPSKSPATGSTLSSAPPVGPFRTKTPSTSTMDQGQAVREYTNDCGPVDYVLFVDRKPVGITELNENPGRGDHRQHRGRPAQLPCRRRRAATGRGRRLNPVSHFGPIAQPLPSSQESGHWRVSGGDRLRHLECSPELGNRNSAPPGWSQPVGNRVSSERVTCPARARRGEAFR